MNVNPSTDQCRKAKSGSLKKPLILLKLSIIPKAAAPVSSNTKQTINPNTSQINNGIVFKKP